MKQVKWFERKFDFSNNQNTLPSILERLSGTPVRLEEKFKLIPLEILTLKINDSWSIKENAGHMIDLEPLWQGRLEDILNGETELRHADLQNTKTDAANHNSTPADELLKRFRMIRQQTLDLLENLTEEQIFKSALHPRLKTPIRTMDLFLFVAEHDDHHLARITALTRLIGKS